MFSRTLTLAVAATAAMALAGSAQAAVIDNDSVLLTGTGYDFGGGTLVAGAPTSGGDVDFKFSGGKVTPHLTGTLHLNDADGTCARMKVRNRDSADKVLSTRTGGTVCADDDRHHEFTVDLTSVGDSAIENVKVVLEKKTASGWSTVDTGVHHANTFDDKVKITEDGVDFGSSGFAAGVPTGSGEVAWDLRAGNVTPRLTGYLHLNNSSGVCARMRIRYLTETGSFLIAKTGGEVCADDNGHHQWSVDLSPYDSNKIGKVEIQLQTQGSNGSWNTAGSKTVSIAQ